jgi:DNA gyrase subunit B
LEVDDIPPFEIYTNDRDDAPVVMEDKRELLQYLLEDGKKGINIQRYKGLGEMNPEQLWQTTMHPDRRNLLKVKVEDAVESDEIFTVLMGDEVEPRRDFIQNNALEVSMLDIVQKIGKLVIYGWASKRPDNKRSHQKKNP